MAKKPEKTREFKTAADVVNVIKPMEDIERVRASDRAKIDDLFNGKRPYTPEEEEKFQIQINVNWQEGKRIMRDANAQVNSALLHQGQLFNCTLEKGPVDKRDEWSQYFTANIHHPIQRGVSGRRYYFTLKSRNASVCMHGIGALLWPNDFKWMPRFVPMEDLLVPTETLCDFTNARYFAVNVYLTAGELVEMTQGDTVAKGWNTTMVQGILDNLKDAPTQGVSSTWRDQPEAMAQLYSENKGYYYSDAIAKVRARWFFYQQTDEPNKWYRCMILREAYGDQKPDDGFLFDGTEVPFADDISQILSIQYGDNNLVAPLKYHCVRGLGVDLYAPVETQNRLRCQFVQSVFEHLLMYFRIQDPSDRDRLKQIVLSQFGVLPEGLQIVPRDQRHQIDAGLVEGAMSQVRQIMQESSSSYLQGIDDGSQKEMTAKEATIKLNQATVMVSSMLQSLYLQEGFFYNELVRRFCKKGSTDPQVLEFQKSCKEDGIPEVLLHDYKAWRVTPERVLGGGDHSQAQQEAGWLWQNSVQFDPAVQPKLKRLVVSTLLRDPDKAKELVPLAKVEDSDGVIAAENVFGTLMQGQQCAMRKGIDQIGYIETILKMCGNVIKRIESTDNMGTTQDVVGLVSALDNAGQHIMVLAQDKRQNQRVKQYGDVIGQMMNKIKGFAQRIGEKRQSEMQAQQGDPAGAAKAQSAVILAATKAKIAEQSAALKNRQKQIAFQLDEMRRTMALASQLKRDEIAHHQQLYQDSVSSALENLRALSAPQNSD